MAVLKNKNFQFVKINWDENIAILIGIIVFIYAGIRAATLSLTHDEAITYLYHASGSFKEILLSLGPVSSNSHLVNTVLIKIISGLFGNSEFVLRIPALIGCGLYLIGGFKILKLFFKNVKFIISFSLIATNPFLLDFFSCARGYSLGLGFLMIGLYYFLKRIISTDSSLSVRKNELTIIMISMSVLSNLAFLNVFIAIISMLIFLEIKENLFLTKHSLATFVKQLNMRIFVAVLASVTCLFLIYNPSVIRAIRLYTNDYGGVKGFWMDTVTSLAECSLYEKHYFNINVIFIAKIFIFISFIASVLVLLRLFIKKQNLQLINKFFLAVVYIIFLIALSIKTQFIFLNIRYPIDRAIIYLIPIYLILILLLWEHICLVRNRYAKIIVNGLFCVLISVMLLHNFLCSNVTHYYIWRYDAATKKTMRIIYDLTKDKAPYSREYKIGINWLFEPSTNYYIVRNKMNWIKYTDRSGPVGIYDYYYFLDKDKWVIKKYNLRLIKSFKISGAYLASPQKVD